MCTLLATKTGDNLFCYFKKPIQFAHEEPIPISEKEIGGLQYLAGYVVKKLLKRVKNSIKYQSTENQAVIAVLSNAITTDISNQKLLETQNRGGLTGVVFYRTTLYVFIANRFPNQPQVIGTNTREVFLLVVHFQSSCSWQG